MENRNFISSMVYGAVFTALAYPMGQLKFYDPNFNATPFMSIPLQLLKIFILNTITAFIVFTIVDKIILWFKSR